MQASGKCVEGKFFSGMLLIHVQLFLVYKKDKGSKKRPKNDSCILNCDWNDHFLPLTQIAYCPIRSGALTETIKFFFGTNPDSEDYILSLTKQLENWKWTDMLYAVASFRWPDTKPSSVVKKHFNTLHGAVKGIF